MQLYIFNSVDGKHAVPFRLFVFNQNLKVTRFSVILGILLSAFVLTSNLLFNFNFIPANKLYVYGFTALLAVSIVYLFAIQYLNKLDARRKLVSKRIIGSTYPTVIILCTVWMSFATNQTPANNMTMFMFGVLFVGVLWLFSIRSAVFISFLTLASLITGMLFLQENKTLLVLNILAGTIIVVGFYLISRIVYSYHANYFIQLRIIEKNHREIKKIAELRSEMLGIVAHDLRSPINSITALTDLAKEANNTQEEREEYAYMITEACNEAQNIIKDLITIVKGDNKQSLHFKKLNINLFLAHVQQHWVHKMPDKKQLLLSVPDNIIMADLDQDKMTRVLDNLIGNAIKFTDQDGKIHIKMTQPDKGSVQVIVSDNGIGVPEDIKPFLFDRFSKAGRLGLKGEKSHGLGLNICKQIVELHKGSISVDSIVKKGTEFSIWLPIEQETPTKNKENTRELDMSH